MVLPQRRSTIVSLYGNPLICLFLFLSLTSGRILACCYWFCILISVSTYTANLAAFLTVKSAHSPIHNLEDIVKTSYQVGVIKSGIVQEFFQRSKYEKHRQIWQRIKSTNSFFKNSGQAIEWLRQREEAVFIYDGPIISHIANRPPCDLMTGNSKLFLLCSNVSFYCINAISILQMSFS